MHEIMFSDGINGFICSSNETPESVWSDIVYKRNPIEGGYDKIGFYTKTETDSNLRINRVTGKREGAPSVKTYTFIPTLVGFGGFRKFKKNKTMSRRLRIKSKSLKKFKK